MENNDIGINFCNFFAKSQVPGHNDQVFYFSFTFYPCTYLMKTIIISTVHLVCGIHVIDILHILFSYVICIWPEN